MRHEFHPEALQEYIEAARHWATAQPGLELRYIDCVEDAICRIQESPERWRILEDDVHVCLTHVFPYAILYTMEPNYVLIIAVMHCHREPGYWRHRLKNRE